MFIHFTALVSKVGTKLETPSMITRRSCAPKCREGGGGGEGGWGASRVEGASLSSDLMGAGQRMQFIHRWTPVTRRRQQRQNK